MPARRGAGADPEQTRRSLLEAALASLRINGFAGSSARVIGALAGCNQAAIYYHFGGVNQLLVAALIDSSTNRLARYQAVISPLTGIDEILAQWKLLHAEDVASGHITALTELVGAIGAEPALRDGVTSMVKLWTSFVEEMIDRVLAGSPLAALVPRAEVAAAVFALFLGVEMLTHLDGDEARAERLFRAGAALAPLIPR